MESLEERQLPTHRKFFNYSQVFLALLLFMLALPSFTGFLGPMFAQISRKHEFEADAYAAANSDGKALANALLKLYQDNATTLTPDPWYVAFYHSHPPAAQRLARMGA